MKQKTSSSSGRRGFFQFIRISKSRWSKDLKTTSGAPPFEGLIIVIISSPRLSSADYYGLKYKIYVWLKFNLIYCKSKNSTLTFALGKSKYIIQMSEKKRETSLSADFRLSYMGTSWCMAITLPFHGRWNGTCVNHFFEQSERFPKQGHIRSDYHFISQLLSSFF